MNKPDNRGAIPFTLGGNEMELVPSFKFLVRAESALQGGVLGFFTRALKEKQFLLNEVASVIHLASRPRVADSMPKDWTIDAVGQAILDEGLHKFTALALEVVAAAITAKSAVVPEDSMKGAPSDPNA